MLLIYELILTILFIMRNSENSYQFETIIKYLAKDQRKIFLNILFKQHLKQDFFRDHLQLANVC